MTKQLIFILTVLCTMQTQAKAQSVQDTVRCTSYHAATELLQPTQPVYLDGVVLPVRGNGNWFVSIAGGTTAFLGTPLGCEDLFGRLKPSYSIAIGKWFTPAVSARINYSGLQLKDARLSTQDYHHIHADLLWNVLGRRYARQEQVRWSLAPFVGIGLLHNATNGHNPFAVSYGVQGQYHISKRVSAMLELSGMTTFQDFDGYGRSNHLGDHMLSLSAGFTFHIGQIGWKRAIDATPYIHRNEWLTDYTNFLSEENNRAKGRIDQDRRTLAELKKILEIEGLLDTYSHLLGGEDAATEGQYPVNNYSGLNSLRARLKNRHWNGKLLLKGEDLYKADTLTDNRNGMFGVDKNRGGNGNLSDAVSMSGRCAALAFGGNECIGSPVYFFFSLNSDRLMDTSQMLNLDELVRVAKKHGLSLRVTGAADSSTGTGAVNESLSASRAAYIATELERRGIPADRVTKVSRGGIADYVPTEANRHTKVELLWGNLETMSE